jgi:putative flippase GtrA
MSIGPRLTRGIEYYTVDAVAFVVNIACAWALTEFAGVNYIVATIIGFALQTVGAYVANKAWTFRISRVRMTRGLAVTTFVQLSVLALAVSGTAYGVEVLGWSFIAARVSAGIVAGLWSYIADSYLTFRVSPLR